MEISCLLRGHKVALTPEEEVRQALIQRMIHELGYPKGQLAIELPLNKLPHLFGRETPDCRLDLLVFTNQEGFHPLMLVECKAVPLGEKTLRQIIGYNLYVQAPYLLLVNGLESRFYYQQGGKWQTLLGIPSYIDLYKTVAGCPPLC